MGTGYTRNDTANNIADGNVINAADFDGEYDAIEAAFNATTGHTHDGTAAEGGPITVVGPVQDVVVSSTEMRPKTTNTLDLGTSSLEYKDLHLAGTANLPTVDIDAGAIDGTTIGANSAAAGTFTNLTGSTDLTLASGATVTAILDEDTMTSDSDTALATQQSIKAYVDSQIGGADELSEVLSNGNTTGGNNIDVDDNDRIRVGANPDLEIYHDTASNQSRIFAAGTGDLRIAATDLRLSATAGTETYLHGTANGAVDIYYDNSIKLSTESTGIDVTGNVDLSTDASAINLGAGSEVNITHVADTGVTLNVENSTTNAVTDVLKLQAQSSGTPAVGIGTGVEFSTETASGNLEIGGVIESSASGLTPTSEEFDMIFKTMSTGTAAAERLKLNGSGATVGNVNVDGNTVSSTDTNGDINLSPNGTGTVVINTDLDVDNINIDGNAITSTNANGNIELTPAGTGEVDISKVDIDGGAIDGVTIGTNSPVTELQVDNININGNSIISTDTAGDIILDPNTTGNVFIGNFEFDADQSIGAGQDNYVLTYDNTGGTIQLEALPGTSISSDTSPALGGTLTADGFNIEFDDSGAATDDRLRFGTGNDLEIYHDGTDSIIDNATSEGSIKIQDTSSTVLEIGADEVTVTGRALSSDGTDAVTAEDDASFDLSANTNFECTPTADAEITFSNIVEGQSGNIKFDNSGGHAITANAVVAMNASALTALQTAGVYHLAYYTVGTSGTNDVLLSVSGSLTSEGV